MIAGATGGYLVAFPFAAFAIGRLAEHGRDRQLITAFAAYAAGQLIIFGIGVPWLKISALKDRPRREHLVTMGRYRTGPRVRSCRGFASRRSRGRFGQSRLRREAQ